MINKSAGIARKGLILVTVPLVFEIIFVSILAFLLFQSEQELEKEAYARRINSQTSIVSQQMLDFMVGVAGYSMTKNAAFEYHYNSAVKELPTSFDKLIELLKDQPKKQANAIEVKKMFFYGIKMADKARIRFENGKTESAIAMLPELKQISKDASLKLHDISEDERAVELKSPEIQSQIRESLHLCLIVGVLFNFGICLALANYYSRSIVNRIETMMENSKRLTMGQDLKPAVPGNDELAVLDQSFHKMATALNTANRKERALVHNAKEVICSINQDGKFVSTNDAVQKAWGYSPEELEGMRLSSIMPAEEFNNLKEVVEENSKSEISFEREISIQKKDGGAGDFVWSVQWSPIDKEYFCVVYDITERKQAEILVKEAEERFRAIVNNIPSGLVSCTASGQVEMINPALSEMFSMNNNDLVGKSLSVLFQPAGKRRGNLDFIPSDLLDKQIKCQAIKSSGEEFPVEVGCHKIESTAGERYLVLVIDISDREEIERLKQEFIMILSHELRSPLTSLKLLLTLLGEEAYGKLSDKGLQKVSNAEKNIARLVRLIQELLDFESLNSDKLSVEKVPIQLSELVDKAVEAASGTAATAGVKIASTCINTKFLGDEDRLSQVIINMLANAIKYSPENGTVKVEAKPDEEFALVKIIDQGPGIKPEYKKMIFERFKQIDAEKKSGKGNVGLGLAVSKAIIEKHGGTLGVDSIEGQGSTFWFKVPRK